MTDTITYEYTDLSGVVEEVSRRYMIRTYDSEYIGKNIGKITREGLGKLSFDLRGRITSSSTLDSLRKLFLENDSEYKKFYYPNSDKFWKVKCVSFEVDERGGELNLYPTRIRLETLDQFQYGTTVTYSASIGTATGGTATINLINDGNVWIKPEITILAIGTTINPAVQDIQVGALLRRITWQGTLDPNETLYIYDDYTARVGGVWWTSLLQGTYPKLEILDGGTEAWVYTEDAASAHSGTVSCIFRPRWW